MTDRSLVRDFHAPEGWVEAIGMGVEHSMGLPKRHARGFLRPTSPKSYAINILRPGGCKAAGDRAYTAPPGLGAGGRKISFRFINIFAVPNLAAASLRGCKLIG